MSPARETILIVDDQEENIRVVGSVLSLMSYDIIPATSAEQALRRLQARTPDIILLDVMMPGTDGLTACRQIRQNPAWQEIPIIFLSAADDKNVIVQALEAGGVDYVTKPFNRAELLTRVRTHLSLKQASDHLRRLAEDKDEILGILAHDLKNGIAGIQLSSSLLHERGSDLPPRSASLVENIQSTSDRLMEHLKHFLANQRAEQLTLTPAPLDPAAVLQKAVSMSHAAALAKNISLTFHPPAQSTHVMADHEALLQVFDNLISNAIKFTPPGGRVHASAENPALGFIRLRIRDSGPGFSEEDRARLFRRYQRLSARPTASESSTGLGLSIVQRLLTQMQGEIHLAPADAAAPGASFIVQLPLATQP